MAQNITCPFCFHTFAPSEVRFRCLNATCTGKAPDAIYANARGQGQTLMGRVLVPNKRMFGLLPNAVRCDACERMSQTRLCPACHFQLPHDVGQAEQRIIAIIGGRATGKTNYIASLMNRLGQVVVPNFDCSIQMLDENTQIRWQRDFYTPLFVNKTVLQPTQSATINSAVKAPLIFRLMMNGRALNLSFFDTAGEDMTSVTTMSVENRYICYAHGIIFLLDPLQIPDVRQRLPKQILPPEDPMASPSVIVQHLRTLFELQNNIRPTQKVTVPIAFALSKIDALSPLLDRSSALMRPSDHPGYVNLEDVESVNTEISNYLKTWIGINFYNTVRDGFAHYHYFGVSSLGEPPDSNNHLSVVSPLRVEDPFLWILYKLGLVRGRKG